MVQSPLCARARRAKGAIRVTAYAFRLNGPIIPYVRMTRRGLHVSARAQAYLVSQDALRWQIKGQMGHNGWAMLPERTPLAVTIHFGYVNRRADLDNLAKAVLDACNGIVWTDDRWIDFLTVTRCDVRMNASDGLIALEVRPL